MEGAVSLTSEEGRKASTTDATIAFDKRRTASGKTMADYEAARAKSSQLACYFNLANTILGSGILGMPFAYAASGYVLGTVFLMCAASASAFGLHNLSKCALKLGGPASYYAVAAKALPQFVFAIDAAVAINCFGTATSYLVVIGGLMPSVMQQFGATGVALQRELWVGIGFCIVTPLVCMRNLDSLRFTSTMSICFVFFLTLVVVLYSANVSGMDPCAHSGDTTACAGPTVLAVADMHTFKKISIFIFGFNCHQNIFTITNEIANPTQSRVNIVIVGAIGTAFCVYLTFAACGYRTFGSLVESNILRSYPENYLTSMARMFVCLLVCFCYPLQVHPSRRCFLSLLHNFDLYRNAVVPLPLSEKKQSQLLHKQQEPGDVEMGQVEVNELTKLSSKTASFDTEHPDATSESAANELHRGCEGDFEKEKELDGGELKSDLKGDLQGDLLEPPSALTPKKVFPPAHEAHALVRDTQQIRFTYVTVTFLSLSLLIAMLVSDLGTVLAVCGATGSTTVSYILPGFFYYFTFKDEGPAWRRNLALAQGIMGLCIVPTFLTFIFI